MANIKEKDIWEDHIYQIETSDPVLGGENGIANRQAKQLAARTQYLKKEVEQSAVKHSPAFTGEPTAPTPEQSTNNQQIATTEFVKTAIAALVGSAPAELDTLEELAALLAENGDLRRTLLQKIGEKAPLAHKHTTADIEGLNDALDEAGKKGVPVGAVVAFPNAVANPAGFLKCDGTTFTQSLYPDLYQVLGNQNKLPDLTRSDVGMTAYFSTDNIPAGWIAFDQIRTQVTQSAYPELYRYLVAKYGSIEAVPLAEDRFLRNAHGDLTVGQTQEDAIRNITGHFGPQDNMPEARWNELLSGAFYHIDVQKYGHSLSSNLWNSNNPVVGFDASRVVPTAKENRPKSIALKLCIKTQNTFDDVQFWVKAFGSIDNQGLMDASQIAITLQGKADLGHTHQYTEITDFSVGVAAAFSQNLAENGWQKLPNGLILQWGNFKTGAIGNNAVGEVSFPISFPAACFNVVNGSVIAQFKHTANYTGLSDEGFSVFEFDQTKFRWQSFWAQRDASYNQNIYWFAIGY